MIEAIIFDWIGTLYQFGGKGLFPYSERVLQELRSRYKLAAISKAVSNNVDNRLRQMHETTLTLFLQMPTKHQNNSLNV